tara:strand:+ start:218 stop:685 length:468 start_codon:yes stop_codon:yes gene_type:complete
MSEESDRENTVKTLVDQLREGNTLAKKVQKEDFNLEPGDLEQFILNNSGRLIQDSMDTIDNIKQFIISAPEPEDVHSLAELYKASTGALETLNKIFLQQKKAETTIKVKTMDIESKSQLADIKQDKLTFTREEIFDQLLNSGKVIEAEVTEEEEL